MRLKLFAEGLDSLKRHKIALRRRAAADPASVKPGSAGAIARFAEIADRTAAEALRGTLLTVPRSALPPLEEGEYYHADLIGLPCEGAAGEALGTVVAVENFGAGDMLEIEAPGRQARDGAVPRPASPTCTDGRIVADPVLSAASAQQRLAPRARSLRIVVAATPPSPMAWLIWSRPRTTSPAA